MKRTRLPLFIPALFTLTACPILERQNEKEAKPLLEIEVEIEQESVSRSTPPPCDIEIQPLLATVVGDTLIVEWDSSTLYTSEVYIAAFSGWSSADYFYNEIHLNTGSFALALPNGLPPSNTPLE